MDTIKRKLQYTKIMDDNRRSHAQPIYYYKATKRANEVSKWNGYNHTIKKYNTQKIKDDNRGSHAQPKNYLQSGELTTLQSCKCYHPARLLEKDQKPSPDKIENSQ